MFGETLPDHPDTPQSRLTQARNTISTRWSRIYAPRTPNQSLLPTQTLPQTQHRSQAQPTSNHTSSALEVPIVFSPSTEQLAPRTYMPTAQVAPLQVQHLQPPLTGRSRTSTRSIIDRITSRARPLTIPASSVYSPQAREHVQPETTGVWHAQYTGRSIDIDQPLGEEYEQQQQPEPEFDVIQEQHDLEATLPGHARSVARPPPQRTFTSTSTSTTSSIHKNSISSTSSASTPRSKTHHYTDRPRHHRQTALSSKIATKKTLTFAFALTFLSALITYIVLMTTDTGSGLMFHFLSLLFILILLGCLLHSMIRLIMLRRRREARAWLRRTPSSSASRTGSNTSLPGSNGMGVHVHTHLPRSTPGTGRFPIKRSVSSSTTSSHDPEKGMEVLVGPEEKLETTPKGRNLTGRTIAVPPPVYGCSRGSKRLDPSFLHPAAPADPSPTTPTYEEAMAQARRAVGYPSGLTTTAAQAPEYTSPGRQRQGTVQHPSQIVQGVRTSRIHPLERERVAELVGCAL